VEKKRKKCRVSWVKRKRRKPTKKWREEILKRETEEYKVQQKRPFGEGELGVHQKKGGESKMEGKAKNPPDLRGGPSWTGEKVGGKLWAVYGK